MGEKGNCSVISVITTVHTVLHVAHMGNASLLPAALRRNANYSFLFPPSLDLFYSIEGTKCHLPTFAC